MPSVLIAGCGYVGLAAARLFREENWEVTGWSHSGGASKGDDEFRLVAVDLRDRDDVMQNRFTCDVVVHCASSRGGSANDYRRIYRDGLTNLAAAFPRARILFTSSTSVYPQRDGSVVDENSCAEPETEKGKILRESEGIVLPRDGIVLRLGAIYGPRRWFLLQSLKEGIACISGVPDRYLNHIHRDDAASAILFLARQTQLPPAPIFNVVDNSPALRSEVLTWLSAQTKIPFAQNAPVSVQKRAHSNKCVSNAKLRAQGWSPIYPSFREGFASVQPAFGS